MSLRNDLLNQIVTDINALGLVAAGKVYRWQGDEEAFNAVGEKAIFVGPVAGRPIISFGESEEHGAETHGRTFHYGIYVACRDVSSGDNADVVAYAILEGLETGFSGSSLTIGTTDYKIELDTGEKGGESLVGRRAQQSVYEQQYIILDVESH